MLNQFYVQCLQCQIRSAVPTVLNQFYTQYQISFTVPTLLNQFGVQCQISSTVLNQFGVPCQIRFAVLSQFYVQCLQCQINSTYRYSAKLVLQCQISRTRLCTCVPAVLMNSFVLKKCVRYAQSIGLYLSYAV